MAFLNFILGKNILFPLLFFCLSCKSVNNFTRMEYTLVPVTSIASAESEIRNMIKPYKDTLDSLMNEVIAYSETDLVKEQTEGSLGNFVCDELLEYARMNSERQIHFCMLNNGGLRVPSISKGPIRVGQIYELLPFENTLEIIEMDGASCKKLLDRVAEQGGAAVAGIRFKISGKEAYEITVNENPFEVQKNYFILTNDYLANGGEEGMKKVVNRYPMNKKLRDSFIEHLRIKTNNARTIKAVKDGRILKME